MGDEDEGDAGARLNGFQLFAHGLAQLEVQRRKRFVEQQDLGMRRQCTSEGDTLLLTARQLRRLAVGKALHLHQGEHLAHPFGHLRFVQDFAHRVGLKAEGQVLGDGHVREQRVMLEHRVDRALEGRAVGDVFAVEQNFAFGREFEPGDHPQERGFAAARRAEKGEELVVANVQVDAFERHRASLWITVDFAH
ncbi:hypothetical protein D3C85_980950 [compost metagenome]